MKPRLVFVHGIGGPRDTAAELDGWMGALAKGAAEAGHSRRVPGLLRGASADARFAYYGDLFAVPQVQGAAAPKDREAADVRALLSEALDEREAAGAGARDLDVLRHARAQLAPQGPAQGIGSIARQILGAANTLLALPGLRAVTQVVGAFVVVIASPSLARRHQRPQPMGSWSSLPRNGAAAVVSSASHARMGSLTPFRAIRRACSSSGLPARRGGRIAARPG